MAIKQELDDLRHQFPDCLIAAFSDISTGMVLSASYRSDLHQEHLDALCATGADMLRGDASLTIVNCLSVDPQTEIVEALMLNPKEIGVYRKASICGMGSAISACHD